MIWLYKNGDTMAIETNEECEEDFVGEFCTLLAALIDRGVFQGDWDFQLRQWLPQFAHICCAFRKHPVNIVKETLLLAGHMPTRNSDDTRVFWSGMDVAALPPKSMDGLDCTVPITTNERT